MKNKVILNLKMDISNLAGYEFGIEIYDKQVKGRLDLSRDFEIIFPDHIIGIASSFVQGFFSEIVGQIGLLQTEKHAKVKTANSALSQSILKKLE